MRWPKAPDRAPASPQREGTAASFWPFVILLLRIGMRTAASSATVHVRAQPVLINELLEMPRGAPGLELAVIMGSRPRPGVSQEILRGFEIAEMAISPDFHAQMPKLVRRKLDAEMFLQTTLNQTSNRAVLLGC